MANKNNKERNSNLIVYGNMSLLVLLILIIPVIYFFLNN